MPDNLDPQNADNQDQQEQQEQTTWTSGLAQEVATNPSISKFKDLPSLAQGYIELEKVVGKKGIPLPTKPEEYDAVFDKLGRPKTPDLYNLPQVNAPEDFPMETIMPKETVAELKATAHKLGLLPQQVEGLYKWFMEKQVAEFNGFHAQRDEAMKNAEAKLRQEYGKAYDNNIGLAKKLISKFADPDTKEAIEEGLGNDPRMVRFLVKVGKLLSEDAFVEGKGFKSGVKEPNEAKEEISKIMNDKTNPYHIANHPEHNAMVEKMTTLFQQAYPEPEKEK